VVIPGGGAAGGSPLAVTCAGPDHCTRTGPGRPPGRLTADKPSEPGIQYAKLKALIGSREPSWPFHRASGWLCASRRRQCPRVLWRDSGCYRYSTEAWKHPSRC
jgi:hypothetical protein